MKRGQTDGSRDSEGIRYALRQCEIGMMAETPGETSNLFDELADWEEQLRALDLDL